MISNTMGHVTGQNVMYLVYMLSLVTISVSLSTSTIPPVFFVYIYSQCNIPFTTGLVVLINPFKLHKYSQSYSG